MKAFFDHVTRLSIRYRWLTIALVILSMALGMYAALDLNIELVPPIDIPSTYILARTDGATDSEIMLHAYTKPVEDGAADIDGVVNRESTTTNGFVFLEIRNEFGLDQQSIRDELRDILHTIPLPTRTITPPDDMTPRDMIAALTPEVVNYLYAYSMQEDLQFLSALDDAVWNSFTPEVLGALPDEAFQEIDRLLAENLQAKRQGEPQQIPAYIGEEVAPLLPASWQMDRFSTAWDLIEITGIRNLADIFNDFIEDGYITGPLGTITDLTVTDINTLMGIQERCIADVGPEQCPLFGYLDGASFAALLAHFDAGVDGTIADGITLPHNYLDMLDPEERSQIATALLAQELTGNQEPRNAELPDELQFEKPQLVTFSFSDIPLGVLSVSADMSRDELQHLVENEIVPRLEALEDVANVTIQGGEKIREDLLNEALAAEGLLDDPAESSSNPAQEENESQGQFADESTAVDDGASTEANNDPAMQGEPPSEGTLDEGPALPASWAVFAGQIPGVDEIDTADDLLRIPGIAPSMLFNQAASLAADNPAAAVFVTRALGDLSPDVLRYLAQHEDGFYGKLLPEVLNALAPETLTDLPPEVQERAQAAGEPTPVLGEFWQRLAVEPEFANTPLRTAGDLSQFNGGAANTLNQLIENTPPKLEFYTVQLINDLTPAVIESLSTREPGFITSLEPATFCYMSAQVLNMAPVRTRWQDQAWECTYLDGEPVALDAIASGDKPSIAQSILGGTNETRVHDPEAPALPSNWPPIAGFVGAQELDTADDLFYTTENGNTQLPSERLNDFASPDGAPYLNTLTADVLRYIADCDWGELCEEAFYSRLSDRFLTYLPDEAAADLPENIQDRRRSALLGIYVPEDAVTRTNGANSLILNLRKRDDANTVTAWDSVQEALDEIKTEHPEVEFDVAFEQATYIEESISGVAREGGLGAVMAVVVILIFLNFSVRSTVVTAVSIPTSVALAFIVMRWVPGNVHDLLFPLTENVGGLSKALLTFVLRLFPENVSLNIMTLSGLTVAIGRVVDDAIVVLENIYRNLQKGEDQLEAVLHGTRDVSVAIFAATVTTVVVFLPIGLFGGVIGAFFLPFGLAVTYALLASFAVAITIVPLLAYLFIKKETLPEEQESRMETAYRGIITWSLNRRAVIMVVATVAFVAGVYILTQLPTAFLPSFGEPTITVSVTLPDEINGETTTIAVTDVKVRRLEASLQELDGVEAIQTSVGSTGNNGITPDDSVAENEATITLSIENQERLETLTPLVRQRAEEIFNDLDRDGTPDDNQDNVAVSGASLSEQGFGGFAVVVSGDKANPPTLAELKTYDQRIIDTLENINGVINVESSLSRVAAAGATNQTYIRIDGVPAARYTAELETDDTLGLTRKAIDAVKALNLPDNLTVSEGFESEQQTKGFQQTFIAMGIAILIVYGVMVLTFGSLLHPITILFSLPLAIVGAAVGLALTGRVLGLSAVVGLLMLVGIVVTNAIVLIDRVQTNRKEHGMPTRTALIEGGTTRLRPILMTAIATMVALMPLAIGLSEGAIIAAELGTVVIGGLFSSTLLTLIVVPVVFSLFDTGQNAVKARLMKNSQQQPKP